ncbi:hypothetical protein BGX21_011423, partial [Mortierella sp. AD011]
LQPLRIPAYPDTVLDVAIEIQGSDIGSEFLQVPGSPTPTSPRMLNLSTPTSPRIPNSPTCISLSSVVTSAYSSADTESITRSTSPTSTISDNNNTQRIRRAPQDRSYSLENIFCSGSRLISGSIQYIPDSYDGGPNYYSRHATRSQYSNSTIADIHEERDMDVNYVEGLAYFEGRDVEQDYVRALDFFLKAANQGHAYAQYRLRNMHKSLQDIKDDCVTLVDHYRMTAEQGDADSQSNLGFMYGFGIGVAQDYSMAVEWYQRAANQGHAHAQCSLGLMYLCGCGVSRDHYRAEKLLRKAVDQGYANAQFHLGSMYHRGYGLTKDYAKVIELYHKAADQGYAQAQYFLGRMYHRGYGVSRDNIKALELYQRAADQGCANAQFHLGSMYHRGFGTAKDHMKAAELYRQAAEQGYAHAQYFLGCMYELGIGVKKDVSKAKKWYQDAGIQGEIFALRALGFTFKSNTGVTQNDSTLSERNQTSQTPFGQEYPQVRHNPEPVRRDSNGKTLNDKADASEWYNNAVKQGDVNSKEELDYVQPKPIAANTKAPLRTVQVIVENEKDSDMQRGMTLSKKKWFTFKKS